MSEPRKNNQNKLSGALSELASAMSALNMYPEKLEKPGFDPDGDEVHYLRHTDKWANHCYEHLEAAIDYVCAAMKEKEQIETTTEEYLRLHELRYKIITNQRLSDEEAEEHQKLQTKHEAWLWSIYNENNR